MCFALRELGPAVDGPAAAEPPAVKSDALAHHPISPRHAGRVSLPGVGSGRGGKLLVWSYCSATDCSDWGKATLQLSGVAIVCALLFLEEAGLPLPVAPGEAILIGAGLLVASGAAPVWLIAPLAYLAVICGVLTGYAWANRIGPKRLHAFAARLHAAGPYDRAAARLRTASPLQVAASRLLPGLRVYTSLIAGAVGLNFGRFMIGVLPASALWVVAFMGLGIFVGAPVERLLGRFEAYGLQALVVVGVVIVWVGTNDVINIPCATLQ